MGGGEGAVRLEGVAAGDVTGVWDVGQHKSFWSSEKKRIHAVSGSCIKNWERNL